MGIRIDALDAAAGALSDHEIPAMRSGATVKLTVGQIATLIVALVTDSAPATLDTLNELAAALGDDPNFATTITNALATKAPLASPTFTGVPAAPTAALGTNTTQLATMAAVKAAVDAAVPASASATYTSSVAIATAIPFDNTIPQQSEGTEILTVSLAAKRSTSKVEVDFVAWGVNEGGDTAIICPLFIDGGANAVQVTTVNPAGANFAVPVVLKYEFSPGDTTSRTFKIRAGLAGAGNLRFNGTSAGRLFGGASAAVLTVREIFQ